MALALRRATAADARALAELEVRAFRDAYAGMLPEPFLDGLDADAETPRFARFVEALPPDQRCWIADDARAVAGFACTAPAAADDADLGPRAAEVAAIYLQPSRIGTGLGRWLFSHAVNDLLARGHGPICVYAFAPDARAIAFSEHHGFAADGRRRTGAVAGGPDEVRLVRRT